ncbi:hypothetical protein [Nocardia sp. NPDC059239]
MLEDQNLVSPAGLVPVMRLAEQTGPGESQARKLATLITRTCAGGKHR